MSDAPTSATLRGRNRLVSRSPVIWKGMTVSSLYLRWNGKEALLLDTLIGGAMMHAMVTPDDRRADLARSTGSYAAHLVSFLLRAVTPA